MSDIVPDDSISQRPHENVPTEDPEGNEIISVIDVSTASFQRSKQLAFPLQKLKTVFNVPDLTAAEEAKRFLSVSELHLFGQISRNPTRTSSGGSKEGKLPLPFGQNSGRRYIVPPVNQESYVNIVSSICNTHRTEMEPRRV